MVFSATQPGQSIGQSAEGFIGAAQAIGKAAVNITENFPVVGLVAKPVIGAIGAVADATVGNAIGAVSRTPFGEAIGAGTNAVAGLALAPLDAALKVAMAPSMWIQQRVAEARIKSTVAGRSDLVTKLFGNAPDSVVNELRSGKEVDQIASEMVSQFGVGPSKMGAFSEDAVRNLAYTILLDPFNLVGDIVFKPITMGARAAQLTAVGTRGLVRLSMELKTEAKALAALGEAGKKLSELRLAESVARRADAEFMQKWSWTGKYYSATFGKVKNPLTKVFGEKIGKTIANAYLRVSGSPKVLESMDLAAVEFGAEKVNQAIGHAAVSLKHATAVSMSDAVVSVQRNVFEATAQNLVKDLHAFIGEGADAAAVLVKNISDGVTVQQFLKMNGMAESQINKIAGILTSKFDGSLETFVARSEVKDAISEIANVLVKTDVKNDPSRYLKIAEYLGKSNLDNSTDAAVALLSSQKLELKRFADVPELGIKYLAQMISHTFDRTLEDATRFATSEFTRLAGDSRELTNLLEFYRATSFGKSMRTVADLRAGFPKSMAELPETIARRDMLAKTWFAAEKITPEASLALAETFDAAAAVSAHYLGQTMEEWYSKNVFGLFGDEVDGAVTIVDTLNNITNQAKANFATAIDSKDVLKIAEDLQPTDKMVAAGVAEKLKPEIVTFPSGKHFALPGGEAELLSDKPYSLIDQVLIASQPFDETMPPTMRENLYKKLWSDKSIDMQDHVAVVNRIVFSMLSPRRDLAQNAAAYAIMRVTGEEDLAKFAQTWGEMARNPKFKDSDLGKMIQSQFGIEKLGIQEQLGYAARTLVFAHDNPNWFKLKPDETMLDFGQRITLLKGAGLKVGVFAPELMRVAEMPVGAIDSQMSLSIWKWLDENGLAKEVEAKIAALNTPESKAYLYGSDVMKNGEKIHVPGMVEIYPEYVAGKDVKGINASGNLVSVGPKGVADAPVSQIIKDAVAEVPDYARVGGTPQVATYSGSSFEIMNQYMAKMVEDISSGKGWKGQKFPQLKTFSPAQQQWFIWDLTRQQIEPHQYVSKFADKLEKPTPDQIREALATITAGGGTRKTPFRGADPVAVSKLFNKNGNKILGVTKFASDGRQAIELLQGADITTAVHEIGHFFRRKLNPTDHEFVLRNYSENGKWTVQSEERFAEDFVNYLYTGKAPVSNLVDVFGKIRDMISKLWSDVSVSRNLKIQPQMKEVFDRLFISNGPSLVKPTDDLWSRVTLISNRTMTQNVRNDIVDLVNKTLGRTDGADKPVSLEEAINRTDSAVRIETGIVPGGGATFNPIRGTRRYGGDGRGGFAVTFKPEAPITGAARMKILTDPREKARYIKEFIRTNEALLRQDHMYIGVYDNEAEGQLSIEVSRVWNNAQQAIESGVKNNQESLYAFNNVDALMYLNTEKGLASLATVNAKNASKGLPQITPTISAEQIPNLESLLPKKYTDAEISNLLEKAASDAVLKYDDLARLFWNKNAKASTNDIIQYIVDHPEVATRELSDLERSALPDAFKAREAELSNAGYRYGIAPQNGYLERTALVRDAFGVDRVQQVVSPYNDILDTVAINALDEQIGSAAKRPTILDRFVDKMTRQYGSDVTRNNYIERLTTDLMAKTSASQKDILTIVARIGNLASRKETTVKGLWFEKDQIQQIFTDVLGEVQYLKYAENNDPFTDIVRAAAGDIGVVGLAPGFSGRVKAWKPIMGAVTDRAYPVARFGKLNPIFFNWLEPIETKMMKLVLDIKGEITSESLKDRESAVLRRMFIDGRSTNLEIAEGLFYDQQKNATATLLAINAAPELRDNISRIVRLQNLIKDGKWAVQNPQKYKTIARNMTASQLAERQFVSLLEKVAPDAWKALQEIGLVDGQSVVQRMLEDYMIQSSPEALARALSGEADTHIGLWAKTIAETSGMSASKAQEIAAAAYGVFQDSMIRGTRTADKYQYFSQYRSWFERSINHPFLGVYPYSYMTQKAIPSMLKLMFAPKILGTTRPGLGLITYIRFKELLASDTSANQGFITEVAKNQAIWYAINIMLPATPENMGFSLPSYLRRGILQPAQNNQPLDLAALSKTPAYVGETVMRGTFLGQGASIMEALGAFGGSVDNTIQDVAPQIQTEVNRFFNP